MEILLFVDIIWGFLRIKSIHINIEPFGSKGIFIEVGGGNHNPVLFCLKKINE